MAQGSHAYDRSSLAADLEWQFSDDFNDISDVSMDTDKFRFLMEGYLHIMEEEADHAPHGIYTSPIGSGKRDGLSSNIHASLIRRTSDPSIRGVWKRRWCVLSQTADGVHLLYYKHQASFTSCESPCGVVLMEGCSTLYTIPSHSKSRNTFSITFPTRNILFYPDKDHELDSWLKAFQEALNLQDASTNSPLKGLPKQKAERKDMLGRPWPAEQEIATDQNGSKWSQKEIPQEDIDIGGDVVGSRVKVLSFKPIPENHTHKEEKEGRALQLKGLPKTKAARSRQDPRHNDTPNEKGLFNDVPVPDLDSEKNTSVQFLGFKMLDT